MYSKIKRRNIKAHLLGWVNLGLKEVIKKKIQDLIVEELREKKKQR